MKKIALTAFLIGCVFGVASGQLFVTDQVNPPGPDTILTFNSPGPGTMFVPNPNSGTQLSDPTGITFGSDGNVYVIGTGNGVVLRYDGMTGAALPGPGVLPPPPMSPPDATFTTGYGLSGAQGITFGSDGNLYVTNANNVTQFNGTTGAFIQNFTLLSTNPTPSHPFFTGITVGSDGALYVADANGTPLNSFGGNSIFRLDVTNLATPFTTFVASNTDGMQFPTGVTFGPDGNLYVASPVTAAIGGEVRRFSGTTGAFIDAFVSPVPALNGNLFQPQGLVFGPDGNLYVSSYFHSPPTLMDPGVSSFVARYDGTSGAFIDYYGQGTTMDGFFGVAFATAIPEPSTVAAAVMLSALLVLHLERRRRARARR